MRSCVRNWPWKSHVQRSFGSTVTTGGMRAPRRDDQRGDRLAGLMRTRIRRVTAVLQPRGALFRDAGEPRIVGLPTDRVARADFPVYTIVLLNPVSLVGLAGGFVRVSVFLVAALVVIACTVSTDVCGCSPALPWGVLVRGTLNARGSDRVTDATLAAIAALGSCPSAARETPLRMGGPPVDSTGGYRVGFFGAGADTLCVRVIARRQLAGRMDSMLSARYTVKLKQDPLDGLRVDFQYP